jgi:hypothetical protein
VQGARDKQQKRGRCESKRRKYAGLGIGRMVERRAEKKKTEKGGGGKEKRARGEAGWQAGWQERGNEGAHWRLARRSAGVVSVLAAAAVGFRVRADVSWSQCVRLLVAACESVWVKVGAASLGVSSPDSFRQQSLVLIYPVPSYS